MRIGGRLQEKARDIMISHAVWREEHCHCDFLEDSTVTAKKESWFGECITCGSRKRCGKNGVPLFFSSNRGKHLFG